MVFGRGGEELEFLVANGFDAEVVPGISSALAAPGSGRHPRHLSWRGCLVLRHRRTSPDPDRLDWSIYQGVDTLVIF